MTRDDIIRMAEQAGLEFDDDLVLESEPIFYTSQKDLEKFAALVAAAEREACAKVCDEVAGRDSDTHAWDAAAAIRARGQHE